MRDPTLTQGRYYSVYVLVCIAKQLDFELDLDLCQRVLQLIRSVCVISTLLQLQSTHTNTSKEKSLTGGKLHQAHNCECQSGSATAVANKQTRAEDCVQRLAVSL